MEEVKSNTMKINPNPLQRGFINAIIISVLFFWLPLIVAIVILHKHGVF